jgi:hypothetical protein
VSNLKRTFIGVLALALLGLPVAPNSAAAQASTKTYQVTVTNITTSMQGLSPLVIATHPASAHAWQMGQPASPGLELLAEEGMPGALAGEIRAGATDVVTTGAHLLPGDSITVTITARDGDVLSAASMLIQTNDGFTGLDSAALNDGSTDTIAYDAGTEDNTERKADVPGPPFGGKNSGPATNPRGAVAAHEGIKGTGDVTPEFKWTGAVARFTIRAIDPASLTPPGTAYDVTITNITTSMQGLSPVFVATHPASAHAWQMGQPASPGLELLAEEGMPTLIATELQGTATDVETTAAHLLPGDSITVRVGANPGDVLSAGTMLIQTNDGFTGLDSVPLTTASTDTMAYDAGTEDNTEAKSDVPGPPFGGKNSGPATNPRGAVAAHEGIKGTGDVTPEFSWTGAVARFTISAVAPPAATTPAAAATPTTAAPAPATAIPAATAVVPAATAVAPSTGAVATPTVMMPNMPVTGGSGGTGTPLWLIVAFGAALMLVLAGLTTRRSFSGRR